MTAQTSIISSSTKVTLHKCFDSVNPKQHQVSQHLTKHWRAKLNILYNMWDVINMSYLEGQNWTSSTVSSCPWKTPRAWTVGPSAEGFELLAPDPGDFVAPWSAANVDTWSWMLQRTTDLSFPATINPWVHELYNTQARKVKKISEVRTKGGNINWLQASMTVRGWTLMWSKSFPLS